MNGWSFWHDQEYGSEYEMVQEEQEDEGEAAEVNQVQPAVPAPQQPQSTPLTPPVLQDVLLLNIFLLHRSHPLR